MDDRTEALEWLALFGGGVFEDNLLDVSGLDADRWERTRGALADAGILTVEREELLAGRPYLRIQQAPAAKPVPAKVRDRFVAAYRGTAAAVRKELFGANPRWAMEVMAREEASLREAVYLAREQGARDAVASMADVLRVYLERAGRQEDRDAWMEWLARPLEKREIAEPPRPPEPTKPPRRPLREEPGGAPAEPSVEIESERSREPMRAVPLPLIAPLPEPAPPPAATAPPEGVLLAREGDEALAGGDIARAAGLYMRALRAFQDARDEEGMIRVCESLGAMEEKAGRLPEARAWRERAEARAKRRGG